MEPSSLVVWGAIILSALILLVARHHPGVSNLCLLSLIAALGVLHARIDAQVPADSIAQRLTAAPQPITCEGVIVSDVEWIYPAQGPAHRQGWFRITRIRNGKDWSPSHGRVALRPPVRGEPLNYGDRVLLHGEVRAGRTEKDSGFNEATRLWLRSACGVLTVSDPEGMTLLSDSPDLWVRYRRWVASFRLRLKQLGHSMMGPLEAAYLESFLLGEGRGIPAQTREAFRNTGVVHVLVVSGQQVTLIGYLVFIGLSIVRISRALRYLLAAGSLVLYCTLTGANPPILRATVMGLLFCLGKWRGHETSALNGLGLAALGILAAGPRALADVSFQLSFAAMLGLLVLSPWLVRLWSGILWKWAAEGLAASCGAWITISPVVAWHFHMVTPIALIANLAVIPWATALIATGFVFCLAGLINSWAAIPVAASFGWMAYGMNRLVIWLAGLPGASWRW